MPDALAQALGAESFPSLLDALLTAARVGPLALLAPWIAWRGAPPIARLAVGVALVVLLTPVGATVSHDVAGASLLAMGLRELLVGTCFAVAGAVPLFAAEHAGRIVDVQRGASVGGGGGVSPMGTLYALLATSSFLALGGHRAVVHALARSYDLVPLGHASAEASFALGAAQVVTASLTIAVALAAPVLVSLFLLELGLGLLDRAAPQVALSAAAAPIRVVAGLGVALLTLSLGVGALAPLFDWALGRATTSLAP